MRISGSFQRLETSLPFRAKNNAKEAEEAREKTETAQDRSLRRLSELGASLKRLQIAASPKQQAASKMAILKRRLETLRSMMMRMVLFISPEQAKEIARELKSIAKEMRAAAHALSGGSGTSAPVISLAALDPEVAATSGEDSEAAAQATQQSEAAAENAAQAEATDAEKAASAANAAANEAATPVPDNANTPNEPNEARNAENGNLHAGLSGTSAGTSDNGLRTTLEEMSRLIKQILALLKTKLTDEEGQKEVRGIEKELRDMEQSMAHSVAICPASGNFQ